MLTKGMMSVCIKLMELCGVIDPTNDGENIAKIVHILHSLIALSHELEKLSAVRYFLILRYFRCKRIFVETVGKEYPSTFTFEMER